MNQYLFGNSFRHRLVRHLFFFLITVLAFAQILYLQNHTEDYTTTLWITFLNALFFFSYAYLTIFLLIPEFLIKQKPVLFILLFVLVGIALSALKLVVSDQIFYAFFSPENIERRGMVELKFIVVNTKDMTFIVALLCITKYVKDYLYAENIRKKLLIQNKAAQAKLIQSQFDPHFLFNTINNLYALSLLNSLKTNEVIHRIKIVLKFIIDEIQKDYVDLKDEVSLVDNYIQLEKLRYGNRLQINYKVPPELHSFKIPPMILFFLVENCFKHGSSLDAGKPWINIELKTKNESILILAENSKPQSIVSREMEMKQNTELGSLRKRLDLIYKPKGYKLKIENLNDTYKVNLELKDKIGSAQNKYR